MEASRGQKTGKSRRCVGRGSHAGQQQGQPSIGAAAAPTSRRQTHRGRRNHETRAPQHRDSGPHLGAVTASEVHTDSSHSTTMARSLGSSMARGLGILLIMMTLSEIAATRARRRPMTNSSPIPSSTPRAAPPPTTGAAGGGGPRRPRERAGAAPPQRFTRCAPEPRAKRRLRVQRGRLDLLHRGRGHLRLLRGLRHRC